MDHRAKLGWARQHLDTLKSEMRDFIDGKPYGMTIKYDVERTKYVVKLSVLRQMPPHWCLRVGDIVHNARSALDALAYALAAKNLGRAPTGDEVKQIQFVIVDDQVKWGAECGNRLRHLDPVAQAVIERLQPYHRPDPMSVHWLSALRDLSNIDKHRHLLVVLQAAADSGVSVEALGPQLGAPLHGSIGGWRGAFVDQTEIATFEFGDREGQPVPKSEHPQMSVKGYLTFDIAFGEGPPAFGHSVGLICTQVMNHIADVVFPALEPFL